MPERDDDESDKKLKRAIVLFTLINPSTAAEPSIYMSARYSYVIHELYSLTKMHISSSEHVACATDVQKGNINVIKCKE